MDAAVPLEMLLRRRPGRFCDDCLGAALGVPAEDVKVEVFARSREFARSYGVCSLCGQRTAVTAQRLAG
jgi:hypothetical protein